MRKSQRFKRKIVFRKWVVCFFTLVITAFSVTAAVFIYKAFAGDFFDEGFVPTPFGKNVSERVEKAEELQLPDWVDVQLIHKHSTARTGIYLKDIKNIVVHYVGNPNTSAQNNRDYFNKITTSVSSHFVIGLEGEIIQCVPLFEKSASSNERNKDTISIEVCHPDESGEFNDNTYSALVKLLSYLCNQFSLDEKDIIRHYDITGKICPKYYVENEEAWQTLLNDVKGELNEYEN